MTTRVWLIRHGEPVADARQRCYGSLDVALSPHGREQMERVGEHLRGEPIAVVLSSPLRRAWEGARIVAAACCCPCETVDGFREIDFGDWEGLTYDEIAARDPELYRSWMERPTDTQFPHGESFRALRTRALDAFQEALRAYAGRTIGVVCHGGVIRTLVAWALQAPDDCLFRIGQEYGAVNLLAVTDDVPVVLLLNLALPGGR